MYLLIIVKRRLNGHLLCYIAYPHQIDATGAQPQFRCPCLQRRLRYYLAQNGINPHVDALGCDNGDSAVSAIYLDSIARLRVIPHLALDFAVGLTPLHFSLKPTLKPQAKHKNQYGQQTFHHFKSINKVITIFRCKQTFIEIFLFLNKKTREPPFYQ